MIETLLLPILIGTAAAVCPKPKPNMKKQIATIFKNTQYGIHNEEGWQYPKFKKMLPIVLGEEEIGTRYIYSVPLGLAATRVADLEKTHFYFTDGLNHPCKTEFRQIFEGDPRKYMVISVFKKDIPELFPYRELPAPELEEEGKRKGKKKWTVPLGKTLEGIVWLNMDNIPHMTVAGVTRFGKTVFLKVLMTYLIEHHPNDTEFYIFDLKGGLEFSEYEKLEQVKGVAGNYVETFLMANLLHAQMHQDLDMFKSRGIRNIVNSSIEKRRFIIVDEAAQLAAEGFMTRKLRDIPELKPYLELLPEELQSKGLKELLNFCQYLFSEIARLGGGLGYRIIYCTQYPTADTLPRQIKMNSDAKITFRLPTGYASEVAIDVKGAERLPSDIKGRALYKTHDLTEMQAPLLTDEEMWGRLEKFQLPRIRKGEAENGYTVPAETQPAGGYSEHPGPAGIRHKGTVANDSYVRF